MARDEHSLPYEIRDDGSILFHLRDEVKLIMRWSTSTKVIVELFRGMDLMPPDTGNLNSSNFREKLARNARLFFAKGDKDTVPNILADLGMVALAMSSPAGSAKENADRDQKEPTLWDILAKGDDPFTLAVKYCKEAGTYFHNAEQEAYGTVSVPGEAGHQETYRLSSRRFALWLRREFYRREKERREKTKGMSDTDQEKDVVFPSRAAQEIAGHMEAIAIFEGHEEEIFTRVAARDGMIYVDLCDAAWRTVEISTDGWRVLASEDTPVRFVRGRGMLALPEPVEGVAEEALATFRELLNLGTGDIGERNWRLLLAWLAQAFMPVGPYPVLTILGPQGSAKSTVERILRNIVDPNSVALRSAPRDEHNLYIDAKASWVIALDNMSSLSPWLSDALCRLATGGGFSTRQLYEDLDQILFDAMRPVILNGIGDVVTRPDLLDRALMISLAPIPKARRKLERTLEADVEAIKPGILAALFDAISEGLSAQDELTLDELPRMADFARWGVATEQALGGEEGSFMDAYMGSQDEATETAIEAWAPGAAFVEFAKLHVGFERAWEGSATDLLAEINKSVEDDALKRSKAWPKTPSHLAEALNRLTPALLEIGVHVERPARSRREGRKIRIFYVEPPRKGPSPSTPPSPEGVFGDTYAESDGDGGGEGGVGGGDGASSEGRHHEDPIGTPDPPGGDTGDGGDAASQTPPGKNNSHGGVVHITDVEDQPKDAYVYIGRSKRYGGPHYFHNPARVEDVGREGALELFEDHLYGNLLPTEEGQREIEKVEAQVRSGKPLACHCAGKEGAPSVLTAEAPIFCHGQILLQAMNGKLDDEGVQGVPLLDDEEEL